MRVSSEDLMNTRAYRNGQTRKWIDKDVRKAREEGLSDEEVKQKELEQVHFHFRKAPERGGFADVWNNQEARQRAIDLANERIEAGDKNDWDTYESVGRQVRSEFKMSDPFAPPPPPHEEKQHSTAIEEMRKGRVSIKGGSWE